MRELYLHKALKDTIKTLDIARLDRQLSMYVAPERLKQVASFGLRGTKPEFF